MVGRPTKLTQELQEKIIKLLRRDNTVEAACEACGIRKQTLYNWLERGETELNSIFGHFLDAVKKAQAEAEIEDIEYIRQGKVNWQARAWIRERKQPGKWGLRSRISFEDEKGKPSKLEIVIVRSRDAQGTS